MVYENYLQVVNRNYLLSLVEYGGIVEIEKTEKQKWNKNKKYKTKSFLNSTSAPKLPKLKINVNIFKKGKKSKNYLNNKKNWKFKVDWNCYSENAVCGGVLFDICSIFIMKHTQNMPKVKKWIWLASCLSG